MKNKIILRRIQTIEIIDPDPEDYGTDDIAKMAEIDANLDDRDLNFSFNLSEDKVQFEAYEVDSMGIMQLVCRGEVE